MEQYPLDKQVIQKLQEIIDKSEQSKEPNKRLSPQSLYNNIYNSTGTLSTLSKLFEVPETLVKKIKHIKTLKEDMTVPNTIRQQLLALDTNAVMCWGSNSFRGTGPIDPFHNGELFFNIQNVRDIKKGYIQIRLKYNDLYTIKIFKNQDPKPMFEFEDIYVDQLIEIIGDSIGF